MGKYSMFIEWLFSFIEAGCVIYFFIRLYGTRIRYLHILFQFIILMIITQVLSNLFEIQTICYITVLSLIQVIFYKSQLSKSIFISFLLNYFTAFINYSVLYILSIFMNIDIQDMLGDIFILRLGVLVLTKLLLFLAIILFLWIYKRLINEININWRICSIMIIALHMIIVAVGDIIVNTELGMEYKIELITVFFSLIAFFMIMLITIYKTDRFEMLKNENIILDRLLNEQRQYIINVEKLYEEARSIRHDTRKYFVVFKGLLDNGQYDEAEKYAKLFMEDRLSPVNIYNINNSILETILNERASECKENNIIFEVKIRNSVDEIFGESDRKLDLAIVILNLLDNAIEKEKSYGYEERKIEMQIFVLGQMCHIFIKNYIDKSVLKSNLLLSTTKKNKNKHGMGIKSVRLILEKYQGNMTIKEEENSFIVHVCIPK